jgi:hypothetical protein
MSADFKKLTPEEKIRVIQEVKSVFEQGLKDPVLVFEPDGFDFALTYFRETELSTPIPEFRFYAQQFVTLLGITVFAKSDLFSRPSTVLKCAVEVTLDELKLSLELDGAISSAGSSSGSPAPLQVIGTLFSSALHALFPEVQEVFWDREPNSGRTKFWMKYPGSMTFAGFKKITRQLSLGWTAQSEMHTPTEDDHRRATAVLEFILRDANFEF